VGRPLLSRFLKVLHEEVGDDRDSVEPMATPSVCS
jgi:hypothetical protein